MSRKKDRKSLYLSISIIAFLLCISLAGSTQARDVGEAETFSTIKVMVGGSNTIIQDSPELQNGIAVTHGLEEVQKEQSIGFNMLYILAIINVLFFLHHPNLGSGMKSGIKNHSLL